MNTCIYMTESLHCSPEITTTLLISYTPIQNKKFKVKKKFKTYFSQTCVHVSPPFLAPNGFAISDCNRKPLFQSQVAV